MKYFLALLLLCTACTEHHPPQKVTAVKPTAIKATAVDFVRLKTDSVPQLQLLNQDGSIWKTIVYDDYFSDSSIVPYAMKPENWLLIFRCVGQENGWYKVVVQEEKQIVKYISCKDSHFFPETQQDNIINACCVGFDEKNNPMREKPSMQAKEVLNDPDTDALNESIRIEGDWLLIQKNTTQGWIKWRDEKGTLLIEIFYDA